MATLEIKWPEYLKPIKILGKTGSWGVLKAKYNTGAEIRRTLQDRNLKTLTFSVYLDPTDDEYQESLKFLNYICGGYNEVWFRFPHFINDLGMIVGAGDGSRQTWVVPGYQDPAATFYATVDNIPAAGTIKDIGANLLSKAEAEADYSAYNLVGAGTLADAPGLQPSFPIALGNSMKMTAVSAQLQAYAAKNRQVAVQNDEFTAHAIFSAAAGTGHFGEVTVAYYNAGLSLLTSGSETVELAKTGKRYTVSKTFTATHADTAFVTIFVGLTAAGGGDAYMHGASLAFYDLPELWHPEDPQPVIRLSAAPSDGLVIKARLPSGTPALLMVADNVSGNLNAIGAREVKIKLREIIHG